MYYEWELRRVFKFSIGGGDDRNANSSDILHGLETECVRETQARDKRKESADSAFGGWVET